MDAELLLRAESYLRDDPDPETREELSSLIARVRAGDPAAATDLADRFQGPLEFGTAGLRGLLGAGESRMNRATVLRATFGLVRYLLDAVPNAAERGLVIGRDARRLSKELQEEAAAVALALGMRVHLLPDPAPTPLAAFAVRRLGAAGGVVVTASHNPPAYNGYKVYAENGAQIIPPMDRRIAEGIAAAPPAREVPRRPSAEGRQSGRLMDASPVLQDYLQALAGLRFAPRARVPELRVAYSALHGVGERVFRRAMAARGFMQVFSVAEQAEPDGRFPTVDFPNPEEKGALDRVLALAREQRADVVLVNDPDADRLGVATRTAAGDYRVLNGNEIGVLLAHHVLTAEAAGAERLVITTIVSSQMLRRMAERLGVVFTETLTGFKWIANRALDEERRGRRFVFGYEEALGYTVGTTVRDKDGISAALVMAELAAALKDQGLTLADELERLQRRFGYFASRSRSFTLAGREGQERIQEAMRRLRARPSFSLPGAEVTSIWDLARGERRFPDGRVEGAPDGGDVLIYELADGGRLAVRPSGTEPKLKLYCEVVEALGEGEAAAVAAARAQPRLAALERALAEAAGLA